MLSCVIFDLDNTLIESDLDFAKIKAEIGMDSDTPVLEYRATLDPDGQARVDAVLEQHESRAAAASDLRPGAREILDFLGDHAVFRALLTRNSRRSVETVLKTHGLSFDMIVAREDAEPEPSPAPVFLICRTLGVKAEETLIVGDYLFDIQSGQAAGAKTMILDGPNRHRFEAHADFEVATLHEALGAIRLLMNKGGPSG